MGAKKQTSLLTEHFEPVMSDDDLSLGEDDADASSEDEPATKKR
jgi:ribosome biogenesis protein ENP2